MLVLHECGLCKFTLAQFQAASCEQFGQGRGLATASVIHSRMVRTADPTAAVLAGVR
jgi:hypothetical protein